MRQRPFRIIPLATLALALTSCSRGSDQLHAQDVASAGNDGSNAPVADDGDGTPVANDGDITPVPFRSPVPPPGSSFVHLFEWRWTDIAKECEAYLGPAGFEAVQVSPPSEHAVLANANYPWWQRYQTVSYSLENSRSGTLDEFEDMVTRCARVGVGIYVDAVINHMTGQASGTGSNGTRFTKYDYPGTYTEADFHMPQCGIADTDYASNPAGVQECELLSLSDLNTGDDRVQTKIAAYLARLVDLGVRGFRIDAAKHMAAADIEAILQKVRASVGDEKAPYYFFEVFSLGSEAITPENYLQIGAAIGDERADVIEFRYALLGNPFLGRGGASLSDLAQLGGSASGFVPSERAVVFVNNHDTQRQDGLFYQDGAAFDLATIFMLAHPYGYPSLMSSYAFARPAGRDVGPPSDDMGNTKPLYAGSASTPACSGETIPSPGSWVCEHRRGYVPGMLAFRKATASTAAVTNFWDNGSNQVAFGRGALGFVAINGEPDPLTRTFETGLPEGVYCDVLFGLPNQDQCAGRSIEVLAGGTAEITLEPNSAAALHVEARPRG